MVNKKELQQYLYGFLLVIAPFSVFIFIVMLGFSGTSSEAEPSLVKWPPFWISMLVAAASVSGLVLLKRSGVKFSRHAAIGILVGITLVAAFFASIGL